MEEHELAFLRVALRFFKQNAKTKDMLEALEGWDFDGCDSEDLSPPELKARFQRMVNDLVDNLGD